ncbi:MAG: response regulator [Thermodesulfobacteriota bacterium]
MPAKKIRVLIVDDEADFAETIVECLALRGFQARAVSGASDAMAVMTSGNWRPDVVVLDLKMPEVNGLETLRLIKQHDPAIQVIMATGHGSTSEGIEGMRNGLYDYLLKPVEVNDLARMITEAVQQLHKP